MMRLLVSIQVRSGHNVSVIYSRRKETPADFEFLFPDSVRLHNVQMETLSERLICLAKIRRIFKEEMSSVVFMHSSFAGFLGRFSLLFCDARCYYIPHCISFMRRDVSLFKRLMFVFFEWIAALRPSTYVACSESEAREIRRWIPFGRCELVENAVDTDLWKNEQSWGAKNSCVIVNVGQIRAQKAPLLFAEIAKKVLGNRSDIKFIWVGDGDTELRRHLCEAGVDVCGWLTPAEVNDVLISAQVFLSTSSWEGMPVAPIEAMLAGCISVLSACPGNVDIVQDGETGYLFSDASQAAKIILNIFSDESLEESARISDRGRSYCEEHYNFSRYALDMECLIGE